MGLFSRRKKSDPVPETGIEPGEQPIETDAGAPTPAAPAEPPVAEADAEPGTPTSVGVSVSSFRGLGVAGSPDGPPLPTVGARTPVSAPPSAARPRRTVSAEAPPPTESAPGLRDNVLLRQALAALPQVPTAPDLMNVARQFLQGHVFLRVHGDARALLADGQPLPLSIAQRGDTQYVLVYSGGAALQDAVRADGDTNTSAAGQPVLTVLKHVLASSYGGVIIDNSSTPARAVLPRPILERAIGEADDALRMKTLLAAARTDATASEAAALLSQVPLWVAVRRSENGALGVAESRTTEGERYVELFSHPLEALALGRGDQAAPLTPPQLAAALVKDTALAGVLIDPGGPWIRLTRGDLAPFLAQNTQA